MQNGWVKYHRKILDNPVICKDSDYFFVWSYLLLNATHFETDAEFKGKRIKLKPGQLITGRISISKKTNVTESKVQRILKRFESEQQIEQQKSNRNRLISILNWEVYQADKIESKQQIEQPVNNWRTTDEQPVNTNKNVINRECKNEIKRTITSSDNDELEKIRIVWNQFATKNNLASIRSLSDKRRKAIKARAKQKEFNFPEILEKIESSDFLLGKKNNWKIDFDFVFCSANNFLKILEGNYDNNKNNSAFSLSKEDYRAILS